MVHGDIFIEEYIKSSLEKNVNNLTDKDNFVVFLDIAIGPEKGISREVIKYFDIFIFRKNHDFIIIIT